METIQQELRKTAHYLSMRKREQAANEIDRLRTDLERLERGMQTASNVIDNHCIAMQSALIDAHERGHQQGLQWIWNTLVGPGLLPDFDEAKAMGGAQAWFDAKTAESEALKRSAV